MIIDEKFKNDFINYINNLTKEEMEEIMKNSNIVFDIPEDVFAKEHVSYIKKMIKMFDE